MHNGCLLLLAFVAVFQPIATYTDRVDGRQQRCDYRTSLSDPGVYFHGTYRVTKPTVEDRRLNHREDIREVRRNEVREESPRTASSPDRRLVDTSERNDNALTRSSRNRIGREAVLRRDTRETRFITGHRDERNQDTRRERLSREDDTHQAHRSSRHTTLRLSENGDRHQSRINTRRFIESRLSVESRRDTRTNGNHAAAERAVKRETRSATNRAGVDVANSLSERRIARERVQRIDTRRSVSWIQHDPKADREILERRSIHREFRSSSTLSDNANRLFNSGESRMASRGNTRSLDRDDQHTIKSRRLNDEQRHLRDFSRIQRQSLSTERKNIRETATPSTIGDKNDRTFENRRDARLFERARSTESRRENRDTERNARLTRSVRSVDDRVSQNDRSFERERSLENQRVVRDARSMDRIRSLERSAVNRQDSRSSDRAKVLEIRNIEREPNMNNNREGDTRRDSHNKRDFRVLERNLRTAEVRGKIPKNDRDACVFDGERSMAMRHRMLTLERAAQSERDFRNIEREIRTQRHERAVASQRATNDAERSFLVRIQERVSESRRELRSNNRAQSQEYRRDARNDESRAFRAERTDESRRNIRNCQSRVFRTERGESQREARNIESREIRMERVDESRRDIRNVEAPVFRSERTDESRRDARNVESRMNRAIRADENRRDIRDVESRAFRPQRIENQLRARNYEFRAFRTERAAVNRQEVRYYERLSRSLNRVAEYRRDSRNNERDARMNERTPENRRNILNTERQSRTEDERIINNRRASRSLERDSRTFGRERSVENNFNRRTVARDSRTFVLERLSKERRERATEIRRDIRNVRKESRLLYAPEGRRVDSRAMNMVRSHTDITKERKNERAAGLRKRDSIDTRPSFTIQRESRTSQRDNVASRLMETDFARKREFQSMLRNPTQAEDKAPTMNWQHLFYTMQGLYICGVLMQLMNEKSAGKKTRNTWWSAPQHLIKVD